MIHFSSAIQNRALEIIKEGYDCADVLRDLNRIEQAKTNLYTIGEGVSAADKLDRELRQKYPAIDKMLELANTMRLPSPQTPKIRAEEEQAIVNLNQDYWGILCDTTVKKGLAKGIKDCIEFVD